MSAVVELWESSEGRLVNVCRSRNIAIVSVQLGAMRIDPHFAEDARYLLRDGDVSALDPMTVGEAEKLFSQREPKETWRYVASYRYGKIGYSRDLLAGSCKPMMGSAARAYTGIE